MFDQRTYEMRVRAEAQIIVAVEALKNQIESMGVSLKEMVEEANRHR